MCIRDRMSPRSAASCARSAREMWSRACQRERHDSAAHIHLAARGRGALANRGMWAFLSRNRDAGLLMLRLTLGALFLWAHGWAKLTGGIEGWRGIGSAMSSV